MKLEIGKTYLTANGRFIKIHKLSGMGEGITQGYFENDGRGVMFAKPYAGGKSERYEKETGKHWNYIFPDQVFNTPELDIIMEDSPKARELAENMKIGRKQKAFEETM